MPELEQYTIVCRDPDSGPGAVCAYTGDDISQIVGVTMAHRWPEQWFGWIQETGRVELPVVGGAERVYLDFYPNVARVEKQEGPIQGAIPIETERLERLCKLDPLIIELGEYCNLLREARDVFVDGHFYSCVAMCGIAMERFQFDKAKPYGASRKDSGKTIRHLLKKNKVLKCRSLILVRHLADLRNDYAHGHGTNPPEDAIKALAMVQKFIRLETDLMRKYHVVNGKFHRKT